MGGMKKRQETTSLRSSSLRRDSVSTTKSTNQTTNAGCMSGIFHFVSKYHTRRKFLTFGKAQQREATKTAPPKPVINATSQSHNNATRLSKQSALELPRSPAIPAEIRRSSIRSSGSPKSEPVRTEVAAEKRRKLLGALEKCDEDLQALKRVIMSVRGVQTTPPTTPSRGVVGDGGKLKKEEEEVGSEEPSPVSVLDCHQLLDRSPILSCSKRTREGMFTIISD